MDRANQLNPSARVNHALKHVPCNRTGNEMLPKHYHKLTNVWSQRCLTLHFVAWSIFFVYHFKVSSELSMVKVLMAEIGMLSWSIHDAIGLLKLRYVMDKLGYETDDHTLGAVLANKVVETRIIRSLAAASVVFFALFNIAFMLRAVSILIPAFYYMFVSIAVSLTSPWTSRLLLQRVVNAALLDSKPDHEHQRRDKNNES